MMAVKTTRPPRSMNDIKTLAGRNTNQEQRRYTSYFQLGALELERYRRGLERDAAQQRINTINQRLDEIEAEMQQLLAEAGAEALQQAGERPLHRRLTTSSNPRKPESSERERQPRGLRIRY
ncbi:hypothetical protein CKO40_20465 [Halochromatium glycolicum]|uniref:Uncharacterized protein n=2 Tax=Halochromatium glycolicum TaxID=85075 RepID=A0AAJ0XBY7_9GAMM|nr:hypothetical protein [Halochromatium glycolicum]